MFDLPERAFVPGATARPDPDWLHARIPEPVPHNLDRLLGCDAFRYGLDLYHAAFFWEAHEVWEELWQVARKQPGRSTEARALQVLIQITAAALQLRMGKPEGALSLGRKASA